MHSKTWIQHALDCFAPCHCSLCGLPSGRDIELCPACEGELPWLTHSCRQCALPLSDSEARLCGACLSTPPAFDRCVAACAYTPPLTAWVHAAKYQGALPILRVLAYLLRRALSEHSAPDPDVVLPMPLHWRRRWRRGFNQAEEMARALREHPRFASLDIRGAVAKRIRATAYQRELGAAERHRNLRGAFRISRDLEGLHIAVVDDVLTTGASAHALASALKDAGAVQVSIWCCARTLAP